MSNYDQLGKLYDKAEKIIGVRYSVYNAGLDGKDWIEAVEIQFEDTIATINVESDFDTLHVELSEMKVSSDCYIKIATSLKPWNDKIGRSLSWVWLLRNQQGYEDGIRFEFSSKDGEKSRLIITLISIASSIEIYVSQKINLTELND